MELDFRNNPGILSTMVDVMADGVFTVDANGIIVAWSVGAARITGYSSQEVVRKSCRMLEGQNCKGFSSLVEFLANPTPYPWGICNQECKVLAQDGRELYLFGNVSVIRDEQGNVAGTIGTFTDLTSFVLNNEKIMVLEEQTKSRQAFIAINCSAIPETLLESELFGHVRGASPERVGIKSGSFRLQMGARSF